MIYKSATAPINIPREYVKNFQIEGLKGRIVNIPSRIKSSKRIVLVAGHHTSHERMYAFAEHLSDYGSVTMIDMPGFGGMNSFASIGQPISYESYANYLYAVLKTQKLNKNITLFAVSIGSEFTTRMLQMHPESQAWFDRYIALVGFGAAKDFRIKRRNKLIYWLIISVGASRLGSFLISIVCFNRLSLYMMLRVFSLYKEKMQSQDAATQRAMLQMEMHLWRVNDLQSQARTTRLMFTKDLRRFVDEPLSVEFHNIMAKNDQYFSSKEVSKTLRDIFSNYREHYIKLGVHMPSLVDGKNEVAKLFEPELIDEIMGSK